MELATELPTEAEDTIPDGLDREALTTHEQLIEFSI